MATVETFNTDDADNTGTSKNTRSATADALKKVLADTYVLYLKTQNCHWNVVGPMFSQIHLMTEAQYTDYAMAIDEIAERIRALGVKAPGAMEAFLKLSSLQEIKKDLSAENMVAELVSSNETLVEALRQVAQEAEKAGDIVTGDMMIARMTIHEKNIWMLKSILA